MARANRATGLVMAFGAGTLLSAVAYELVPEASFKHGPGVGIGVALGALTYYVGDRIIDRGGGADRQRIGGDVQEGGSGAAMFLGALLDGIPEAFILGITLALGGGVSVAFVVAVFVSNIPQGGGGHRQPEGGRRVGPAHLPDVDGAHARLCRHGGAVGFAIADSVPHAGLYAEAFAGGAVLTMLADSMMPEAFEHGGNVAGLLTVVGYLVAGVLTVLD
jgi:zinc transporter, ZIP family